MSLTLEEQETVIRIGRDDKKARIYTADTRWIRKLDKIAERTATHKSGRAVVATEYIVSEKYVDVKVPRKLKLTADQRAKLAENAKKAREAKG